MAFESVYSMDGDISPIKEIVQVAKAHGVDIVLTREQLKTDVSDSKALLAQIRTFTQLPG